MAKRSKYEKETILLTNEATDTWEVYTFNQGLKRKLTAFSQDYPALCQLKGTTEDGGMSFTVSKARLSIRMTKPYSEERRQKARTSALNHPVSAHPTEVKKAHP